ncbi:MAG: 50S ribosomal protein L10 [Tropheryma whipplei]|uniref:Large ribosomal subunit protein uL10 n=2 Tax=Tropheryma whipplei TaxID=2039 RepID=RL10_TROWT|nr:50S ribosomal protein L10 [Tropheryma whipplei]Q83FL0.1 RecName: Full=Large ribosomal subunit protein uL10; AltName: Full=50S ribosomal protein L10 [Tropheryma whipplei str. Twist]Q83HB1.1 RecName: Full=Large ribosomal subunit protein uL10; AltName: Full=50S ribosomal protein L10 [Tropheryma whipplei TW08/27]AAO44809.1 50S ribosomal protein L10 [Tropheryma whipplei str. Twist]MCO8182473.1 50S ribosomal protein L10 [Tropheryma whipplei]MCO8190317.1 50S ribosomal protein L10 [Tropheryma whipp
MTKQETVKHLVGVLSDAQAIVFTEYRGLSAAQLRALRILLRGDASYLIAKNTLARIAAQQVGFNDFAEFLRGPTAIVAVDGDIVSVAKSLRKFAETDGLLKIKGCFVDGQVFGSEHVKRLAELESREVILAKIASVTKGALSSALGLVSAPLSSAARVFVAMKNTF